ncbi:NPP1-domain-containing protein [Sporormia fimetaria CBS 119925]|uniref:NPP1-domain-containing protein n=1 Tax=Sporormia fimetaria CBS 119925 TaxID=1340428 RepID=A0A6A6VES6_9PLEO|nr:NPP1-domain-containing protein [Sporormia fimetaria CBS 119925]
MYFDFGYLLVGLVFATSRVSASPLHLGRRAVINHDTVTSFPQTVPAGVEGSLMLKYKPWLEVYNGCVPFPAVNAAGDTSGGLPTSGAPNSRCGKSLGQVYSRAGTYNGAFGIMYAWYMPKDSPSAGLGHRHDWENVVVWLSSASETATVRGVAISAHGKYQKTSGHFSGTRPRIGYISIWPVNHQLIDTVEQGGEQPLIAWDSLTPAARSAIETTNFGSATPSFRDNNFQSYLERSFI